MAATLNHICQSSSSVRVLALNGEVLDAHKSRSTSVAGNVHYSLSVGWGARRLHVNRKALSGKKFGPAPAADIRATSGAEVIQQNVPATCDLKSFQEAVEKLEVDLVTEADLKENGFRSSRRTKICCTIGPACCSFEQLEALANGGMNIARLNMCHGTKEWHKNVIKNIRHLNATKGYCVALMMDTEGSEIHMGDLGGTASAKAEFTLNSLNSWRGGFKKLLVIQHGNELQSDIEWNFSEITGLRIRNHVCHSAFWRGTLHLTTYLLFESLM